MSNTIILKKSAVTGNAPASGDLSLGEIAINYADGHLYYKSGASATPAKINAGDADTTDGFHLNQDVRSTASPSFAALDINGAANIDGLLDVNAGAANTVAIFESTDAKAFIRIKDVDTDTYLISKDGTFSIGESSTDYDNFKVNISSGNTDIAGTVTATHFYGDGSNLTNLPSGADNTKLPLAGGNMAGPILLDNGIELRSEDTGGVERTITRVNSSDELEYGWSGAGPVKFMGGGSYAERMRIHTNGNVGIGTTSPAAKFDVFDPSTTAANTIVAQAIKNYVGGSSMFRVGMNAGSTTADIEMNSGGAGPFRYGSYGEMNIVNNRPSSKINIVNNSSVRATIDSSGNVGIGTASPAKLLDVSSASNPTIRISSSKSGSFSAHEVMSSLEFYSADTSGVGAGVRSSIRSLASDQYGSRTELAFSTTDSSADSEKMRIDTNGNVGIGTTSPSYKLTVDDNSVTNIPKTLLQFDASSITDNGGYNVDFRTSSSDTADRFVARIRGIRESTGALSQLSFWTESGSALEQRMTIRASGNVGIGTTSPSYKLQVRSADANDDVAYIHHDNASQSSGTVLKVRSDAGNSTGYSLLDVQNNSVNALYVRGDGNVGIGTTSPTNILHTYTSSNNVGRFESSDSDAHIRINDNADSLYVGTQNQKGYIGSTAANSSNNLTIDLTNGNVGIGTTSPDAPLQIACGTAGLPITSAATGSLSVGSISSTTSASILGRQTASTTGLTLVAATVDGNTSGDMVFNARGNHNGIFSTLTNAAFKFSHYSSDLLVIRRNGNVGIGTIAPDFRLRVVSADSTGVMAVKNTANGRDTFRSENASGTRTFNIGNDSSGAGLALIRNASGVTTTYLSGDGNSYIAGGDLGVGVVASNTRLEVKGATSDSLASGFLVRNSSNTSLFSIRNDGRVDIDGSLIIDTNTGSQPLYITRSGATDQSLKIYVDDSAAVFESIQDETADTYGSFIFNMDAGTTHPYFDVRKNNSTIMRVDGSGNVGIGTDSPTQHQSANETVLHIADSNVASLNLDSTATNGDCYVLSSTGSGDFRIFNDDTNTTVLNIDDAGNVGIGTTSPSTKLHIDDNAASGTGLRVTGGGGGGPLATFTRDVGSTGTIAISSSGGDPQITFATSANTFALGTNGSTFEICDNSSVGANTRLSITSAGNVGIGTTTPASGLHLQGASNTSSGFTIENTSGGVSKKFGFQPQYNDDRLDIWYNSNATAAITIKDGGNVGIGTTTPSAKLEVNGHFAATTKSFIIDNPKTDGRLQYGVVETDEHSVYVRGKSDQEEIQLPEEWEWLVHEDSVTALVTAVGQTQRLFVIEETNKKITVGGLADGGRYNYVVYGTRKDVDALEKHLK